MLVHRVVILGEVSVGKTSLLQRYVRGSYITEQRATVGAVYFRKEERVDGRVVKMELWDTAGQEKYESLSQMYYRNAALVLLVFSLQ